MNATWDRSVPIDRQLRDRAAAMILDGSLKPGDPLPPVTSTAADFRVNPMTVERAYRQLLADELVELRDGLGLCVTRKAPDRLQQIERETFLRHKWPRILECMARLGIDTAPFRGPVTLN